MFPNIKTCENGWPNFSVNLSVVVIKLRELTQCANCSIQCASPNILITLILYGIGVRCDRGRFSAHSPLLSESMKIRTYLSESLKIRIPIRITENPNTYRNYWKSEYVSELLKIRIPMDYQNNWKFELQWTTESLKIGIPLDYPNPSKIRIPLDYQNYWKSERHFIIIIIKKGWQFKAGSERWTPYQSKGISPLIQTHRMR